MGLWSPVPPRISRASAYRYALAGILPTTRLGGRVFIHRDRLRAMLEAA
jgi:hypothetical protein